MNVCHQKYNFVIFLPFSDYYTVRFSDVNNCLNVRIINMLGNFNKDGQFQVNFEPARSVQNPYVFQKPIKLDFGDYFQTEFPVQYPIIFLFMGGNSYRWMKPAGYFEYLRQHYPDCKFVLQMGDTVRYYQTRNNMFINKTNVEEIKSDFDCIITYNKIDAVNLGLTHYIGLYSILPLERQEELYDIFFVGAAKDRLDKIHSCYEYFRDNGFKCNFYITGVPQEFQKYPEEIHYNQRLSYAEVLDNVMRSKGILETAQSGTYGLTMRFFEALVYDKNFITDNGFFYQEKFLSSPKLFYIPPYSKLNIDREKFLAVSKFSNNYKGEYSPVRYLEFLEAYFNSRR